MTDLQVYCYTGTGLIRLLQPLATVYYAPVAPAHNVITLHQGGLTHPSVRHAKAGQVAQHKKAATGAVRRIVIGHSQGAEEALEDAIDNPDVLAAVLVCGPFNGSGRASRRIPIAGVRGMSRGSRYLEEIRNRTDQMLQERETPPELHLVAAHHDGLVSCESAFAITPSYPQSLVHRYCASHGDPHHADADWLNVPWGADNHLSVIWAPQVMNLVRQIVQSHAAPVPSTVGLVAATA